MNQTALLHSLRERVASTEGSEPLYRLLQAGFEEAIHSTRLKRGTAIPSERVLSEELSVSRVTVRKAIKELVSDGLLHSQHGKKTVVSSRLEKSLSTMSSFSEDMRSRGLKPGGLWITKEIRYPSPAEMMALGVSGREKIVHLQRIRTADGTPIAIEDSALPARFLPNPDKIKDSLYELLEAEGAMPVRALQRMQAAPPTPTEQNLLRLPPDVSVLVVERRCFLADGQIVEFTRTKYRGDIYDFVIELKR